MTVCFIGIGLWHILVESGDVDRYRVSPDGFVVANEKSRAAAAAAVSAAAPLVHYACSAAAVAAAINLWRRLVKDLAGDWQNLVSRMDYLNHFSFGGCFTFLLIVWITCSSITQVCLIPLPFITLNTTMNFHEFYVCYIIVV